MDIGSLVVYSSVFLTLGGGGPIGWRGRIETSSRSAYSKIILYLDLKFASRSFFPETMLLTLVPETFLQ